VRRHRGHPGGTALSLAELAGLTAGWGRAASAAWLLGAIADGRHVAETGAYIRQRLVSAFDQAEAVTRAPSEAAFAQALAEGEALSPEQATDLALAVLTDLDFTQPLDPTVSA
jgi:hypothetical protein